MRELVDLREQPVILVYLTRQDYTGIKFRSGTTYGQIRDELHLTKDASIRRNIGARENLDFSHSDANDEIVRPGFYSVVLPGQIRNITFWDELRWGLRKYGW